MQITDFLKAHSAEIKMFNEFFFKWVLLLKKKKNWENTELNEVRSCQRL